MQPKYSIIITSYNEPKQIKKAIEQILLTQDNILKNSEMLVISPDESTIKSAKKVLDSQKILKYKIIKDKLEGKPAALNLAYLEVKGEILILTDGDMYIDKDAVELLLDCLEDPKNSKVGGVSGHPISLDPKSNMFGFFSHLHCHFANINRKKNKFVPMSGYLYAIKNISGLFPIPEEIRSEDAYLSYKIISKGYKIKYQESAFAYVHFPKNTSDWLKQKARSLGGNFQLKNYLESMNLNGKITPRNIFEDIKDTFGVLFYAKNLKELVWVFYLYTLRLILWTKILLPQNSRKAKDEGAWERIESSKS